MMENGIVPQSEPSEPIASVEEKEGGLIRIVIADDHPIFRDGLRKLLTLEPDFRVVAEARARFLDSPSAFSIAQNERDFGVRNAPRRNAIRERFKVGAAAGKQHANAFFHDQRN